MSVKLETEAASLRRCRFSGDWSMRFNGVLFHGKLNIAIFCIFMYYKRIYASICVKNRSIRHNFIIMFVYDKQCFGLHSVRQVNRSASRYKKKCKKEAQKKTQKRSAEKNAKKKRRKRSAEKEAQKKKRRKRSAEKEVQKEKKCKKKG